MTVPLRAAGAQLMRERTHLGYERDVIWPRLANEPVSAYHLNAHWLITRWHAARSTRRVRV